LFDLAATKASVGCYRLFEPEIIFEKRGPLSFVLFIVRVIAEETSHHGAPHILLLGQMLNGNASFSDFFGPFTMQAFD
jgi:hypothetical protein